MHTSQYSTVTVGPFSSPPKVSGLGGFRQFLFPVQRVILVWLRLEATSESHSSSVSRQRKRNGRKRALVVLRRIALEFPLKPKQLPQHDTEES